MKRVEAIFSQQMQSEESIVFSHQPIKGRQVVGILLSPNIELSLAFQGGTALVFDSFAMTSTVDTPPKSKIIPMERELTLMKGKVIYKGSKERKASIYIISQ